LSAESVQAFEVEISQNPDLAEQVALHRLEWDAMEVLIENNLRDKMITWERPAVHSGRELSEVGSVLPTSDIETTPSVSTVVKPLMTVKKGGLFTRYAWAAAASVAILATLALWFSNRPEQPVDNMTRTDQPQNKPVTPIDTLEELDGAGGLAPIDSVKGVVDTLKKDNTKR
jgi:ABC-type sulfate transport system substrate-binding protein